MVGGNLGLVETPGLAPRAVACQPRDVFLERYAEGVVAAKD